MFRVWGKMFLENRLLRDTVVEIDDPTLTRTKKVRLALAKISDEFDLAVPIWLDRNNKEFIRHAKTRFSADNYIESIDFDYLEFHVIEEDR